MPSVVCPSCLHKLECYWDLRNCIKASENILRSNMQPQIQSTVDQSKFALDKQNYVQEVVVCTTDLTDQSKKIAESITIKIEPDCFKNILLDDKSVRTTVDFEDCLDKLTRESGVLSEDNDKLLSNVVLDLDMNIASTEKLKRPSTSLLCNKCDSEFDTESSLELHYKFKHAKIKCRSCKKSFSPDKMKIHNETVHTGSKMFKCQICNSYISLKYYDMHMAVHS